MSVTFTASEYTALVLVWLDYENAHPRPGIGIDPSTGRRGRPGLPWSPPAPFGLDAGERADFLAEHRWPKIDDYVFLRSGANEVYPRAIAAAIASQYPMLESLHARMGLGVGSGSWSQELANWLLTATSEWVCWRGVYIPPDPDTARNRFRMLGFYSPPLGVYAGEPFQLDRELALPVQYDDECPPGTRTRFVFGEDRARDIINRALEAANVREPDPGGFDSNDITARNARWAAEFVSGVIGMCGGSGPLYCGFTETDLRTLASQTGYTVRETGRPPVRLLGAPRYFVINRPTVVRCG